VTAAAVLGPRQAAVLGHLEKHPGLTAGELARVFGLRNSLHRLLHRLEQKACVVQVSAWDPAQGRRASRWYVAPDGTVPPADPPADPAGVRRRRERDRLAQRARRARSRGPAVTAGMEAPSLRDRQHAASSLPAAACAGADPDLFFPAEGEQVADTRRRAAKARVICAGCPVRARCYQGAAARKEPWGIWGGVDFGERRKAARAS
jgi:WhiB family transcriptional regulator, redox-sensing transcriptional regulator